MSIFGKTVRSPFERFEVVIVYVEAELEGAIRETPLTLEHLEYLGQALLKCHHRPSSCLCIHTRTRFGARATFWSYINGIL